MNRRLLLWEAALAASLVCGVASATTFVPTDLNVNVSSFGTLPTGGILGFFSSPFSAVDSYLNINYTTGDQLAFSPDPVGQTTGTFTVQNNAGQSLTLNNGPYFALAFKPVGGIFSEADSVQCDSSNTCKLTWSGATTFAIDLKKVASPTSISLPPSIWLMGSGLVGLVGIARRDFSSHRYLQEV